MTYIRTAEHNAAIGASQKGKILSVEHRVKLSIAHTGNKAPNQTVLALRLANLGNTYGRTHGMTNTPAHVSWRSMLTRCRNQNHDSYPDYGGRGITVCERWLRFENFYADMGERPEGTSLDRIDRDGNYEASNCRWATLAEQQRNKRRIRDHHCTGCQCDKLASALNA